MEMEEILRMKIAVAMACIAVKPHNSPVEDFVKQLSVNYQTSQQKWKDKCLSAETEILHLKQQLMMSRSAVLSSGSPADEQEFLPTPPSSGSTVQSNIAQAQNRNLASIQRHTEFFQAVICLQKAGKADTSLLDVMESSIQHCLQVFYQCIEDKTCTISVQSLQKCAQLITETMGNKKWPWSPYTKGKVDEIVDTIVKRLYKDTCQQAGEIKLWKDKRMMIKLVKCLMSEDTVKTLLKSVLENIADFSSHLRNVCKGTEKLQIDLYDNMAFITDLFQAVFDHPCHKVCVKDREFMHDVHEQLEESLLHITGKFPLFAHAIWKMCGIIDNI